MMSIRYVATMFVAILLFSGGADAMEDQNEALSEVAGLFLHDDEQPIFGKELLPVDRLDFSVASLSFIDQYLDQVHHLDGYDQNQLMIVLRAGAYVGEVIRRSSQATHWRWLDYETARAMSPAAFDRFGKVPGTAAVLYNGKTFVFPLVKVQKRLANGSEDSIQFYVGALLAADHQKLKSGQ